MELCGSAQHCALRSSGRRLQAIAATATLLLATSCSNLDSFESATGEAYCGDVVKSEFIRAGFSDSLRLGLTLDIDRLQTRPGSLDAYDGDVGPCTPSPLFENAPLRASEPVLADSLSALEFGSGREYNFFAWVDSTCQGPMLALISLMQDRSVELRLFKPGTLLPSDQDQSGFALFQLQPKPQSECQP